MFRLAVFLSLLACVLAQCLFNTGVDGSGGLLADGASDGHWQIGGNPAIVATLPIPNWIANTASSKWISQSASTILNTGTYDYTTTFTLGNHALHLGYTIIGQIAADDTAEIFINGVSKFGPIADPDGPTGPKNPYNTRTSFSIASDADFLFGTNTLMVRVTNSNPSYTGFSLELSSLCAQGDPSFVDLEGKRFIFEGQAGKNFHVFSDPFVSINALFTPAIEATGKGTVMSAFGVHWANHSLAFNTRSVIGSSVVVALDGVPRAFKLGDKVALDGCVQLMWAEMTLRLVTPRHILDFEVQTRADTHINTTFFNLDFSLKQPETTLCGGIMGQAGKPSTQNAKFITQDLFSTSALTNKYSAQRMC